MFFDCEGKLSFGAFLFDGEGELFETTASFPLLARTVAFLDGVEEFIAPSFDIIAVLFDSSKFLEGDPFEAAVSFPLLARTGAFLDDVGELLAPSFDTGVLFDSSGNFFEGDSFETAASFPLLARDEFFEGDPLETAASFDTNPLFDPATFLDPALSFKMGTLFSSSFLVKA